MSLGTALFSSCDVKRGVVNVTFTLVLKAPLWRSYMLTALTFCIDFEPMLTAPGKNCRSKMCGINEHCRDVPYY